jgi:transposase, IS6 family
MAFQHGHSSRARLAQVLCRARSPPTGAPVYPRVIDNLAADARHVREQYANNVVEADHGRLKARLRPMRGLKTILSLRAISAGHAFVQNLRRGHYAITTDLPIHDRLRVAFDELALSL